MGRKWNIEAVYIFWAAALLTISTRKLLGKILDFIHKRYYVLTGFRKVDIFNG
jgi:hypothetical protein